MIVLQLSDHDYTLIIMLIRQAQEIGISPSYWTLLEESLRAQVEAQQTGQFVQCALCHDEEKPSKNFG